MSPDLQLWLCTDPSGWILWNTPHQHPQWTSHMALFLKFLIVFFGMFLPSDFVVFSDTSSRLSTAGLWLWRKEKGNPWSHRKLRRPGIQSQTLIRLHLWLLWASVSFFALQGVLYALWIDTFPPNIHSTNTPLPGVLQALATRTVCYLVLAPKKTPGFLCPASALNYESEMWLQTCFGDGSWKVHAGLYNLPLLAADPGSGTTY